MEGRKKEAEAEEEEGWLRRRRRGSNTNHIWLADLRGKEEELLPQPFLCCIRSPQRDDVRCFWEEEEKGFVWGWKRGRSNGE